MRALAKAGCLSLGLGALGACSLPPNLVVARDPVPPPSPQTRIACVSTPPVILNTVISSCKPVERRRVIERRTVVRAKG